MDNLWDDPRIAELSKRLGRLVILLLIRRQEQNWSEDYLDRQLAKAIRGFCIKYHFTPSGEIVRRFPPRQSLSVRVSPRP